MWWPTTATVKVAAQLWTWLLLNGIGYFSGSDFVYISQLSSEILFLFQLYHFTLMMNTDIPDANTSSHGWFWGCISFLFLIWIMVAIGTVTLWFLVTHWLSSQASHDVGHDGLPSFVNLELVRVQHQMPPISTIQLPPTAYLRPSDTFPDIDNSQPPPLDIDQLHQVRFMEWCL